MLRLTQKRRKLASDGSGPRVGEWLLTNPVFVEWMDGDLEAGEGRTLCLSGGGEFLLEEGEGESGEGILAESVR